MTAQDDIGAYMSGNVQINERGPVAVATPEQLAEIERALELGLRELPEPQDIEDDEQNSKRVEAAIDHLCRARAMFRRLLVRQLDRDHWYQLGGPDLQPTFGVDHAQATAAA